MGQHDIKRLLACHSVSQVGYIFIGIGLGSIWGLMGAILHMINHSAFKSLLFLNAGSIEHATGERDFFNMGGLKKRMPWTNITSFIGFSAIGGIPPLNGFWSKLILIYACIHANQLLLALIIATVAIMTLTLFPKIQKYVFLGELPDKYHHVKEVPWSMIAPMLVLSAFCIGLGSIFVVPAWREAILIPAINVLLNGSWFEAISYVP